MLLYEYKVREEFMPLGQEFEHLWTILRFLRFG